MKRILKFCLFAFTIITLAACAGNTTTPTPFPATPTVDLFYASNGGGEPRSAGYWLLWNSCVPENKATQAVASGGREAGWIIMDDLLEDPGILVGILAVETCDQGVNLLQQRDVQGTDRQSDAAYLLASQLLTAQLNLAIGSEDCPASNQAVDAAQLLLLNLEFNGTESYLSPPVAGPEVDEAQELVAQLGIYNIGQLCR